MSTNSDSSSTNESDGGVEYENGVQTSQTQDNSSSEEESPKQKEAFKPLQSLVDKVVSDDSDSAHSSTRTSPDTQSAEPGAVIHKSVTKAVVNKTSQRKGERKSFKEQIVERRARKAKLLGKQPLTQTTTDSDHELSSLIGADRSQTLQNILSHDDARNSQDYEIRDAGGESKVGAQGFSSLARTGHPTMKTAADMPKFAEEFDRFVKSAGQLHISACAERSLLEVLRQKVNLEVPSTRAITMSSSNLEWNAKLQSWMNKRKVKPEQANLAVEPGKFVVTNDLDAMDLQAYFNANWEAVKQFKGTDVATFEHLKPAIWNRSLQRYMQRVFDKADQDMEKLMSHFMTSLNSYIDYAVVSDQFFDSPSLKAARKEKAARSRRTHATTAEAAPTAAINAKAKPAQSRPNKKKAGKTEKDAPVGEEGHYCPHCKKSNVLHKARNCYSNPANANKRHKQGQPPKKVSLLAIDARTNTQLIGLAAKLDAAVTAHTALLDSGAAVNVISTKIAKWLVQQGAIKHNVEVNMTSATGQTIRADTQLKAYIHTMVNNKPTVVPAVFNVLDTTHDIILSNQLCQETGMMVDNTSPYVPVKPRRITLAKQQAPPTYKPDTSDEEKDEICVVDNEPKSDYMFIPTDIQTVRECDEHLLTDLQIVDLPKQASLATLHTRETASTDDDEDELQTFAKSQTHPTSKPEHTEDGDVPPEEQLNIADDVPVEHAQKLRQIARQYQQIFSPMFPEQGSKLKPAHIKLKPGVNLDEVANPHPPYYNASAVKLKQREIKVLEEAKMVELCKDTDTTKFVSNMLLVKKPGTRDKYRAVTDFRMTNTLIEGNHWPLRSVEQILTSLGGKKAFLKCDLAKAFFQQELSEDSRHVTRFTAGDGAVFQYRRLPMGLKTSASIFQRAMHDAFSDMQDFLTVYLDDLLAAAEDFDQLAEHAEQLFSRLRDLRLRINPAKCYVSGSMEFLGRTINGRGIQITSRYKQGLLAVEAPKTLKQLRHVVGMFQFVAQWIPRSADLLGALTRLTQKGVKFQWEQEQQLALDQLKIAIENCSILHYPDHTKPFYIRTDASQVAVSGWAYQRGSDKRVLPIAFFSKRMTPAQQRYPIQQQELLAIVLTLQRFRQLIWASQVILQTDNLNLVHLAKSANLRMSRWSEMLMEFDLVIHHVKGKNNRLSDNLSRMWSKDPQQYDAHPAVQPAEQETEAGVSALHDKDPMAPTEDGPQFQNVSKLSDELKSKIRTFHSALTGHTGTNATARAMRAANVTWKGMDRDIRKYIQGCPICVKTKIPKHPPKALSTLACYQPGAEMHIDHAGPFKEDDKGNKYILVMQDACTRFVFLYATKTTSAISAAKHLLKVFAILGVPSRIRSDNASSWTAELIKCFTAKLDLQWDYSIAYNSRTNSIVERTIQTAVHQLLAFVQERDMQHVWSSCLPIIQRAYNNTIHLGTGLTPHQALLGTKINADRGIIPTPQDVKLPAHLAEMVTRWDIAAQTTRQALAKHQEQMVKRRLSRENKGKFPTYKVGELVLCFWRKGRPSKLANTLEGPFKIIRSLGSNSYELQHMLNSSTIQQSVANMIPLGDEFASQAAVMARTDAIGEHIIDAVKTHRVKQGAKPNKQGKFTKKNDYEFYVSWLNFDEGHNKWLPYASVADNSLLDKYLEDKRELKRIMQRGRTS